MNRASINIFPKGDPHEGPPFVVLNDPRKQTTNQPVTMKTLTLDPQQADLYAQLEMAVGGPGALYAAAVEADNYLISLSEQPAVKQEDMVSRLNLTTMTRADLATHEGLATALACAAMIITKIRIKALGEEFTSSQLVLLASGNLAKKYHTDW